MNKKIAVIDLGTNTFQFCIAEIEKGKFKFLVQKSLATKLGKGGISEGYINHEAIIRAKTALEEFILIAKEYGIPPNEVLAYGTSAIRNAKNGEDFCNEIELTLGLQIIVISGNKEANLISEGVRYAVDFQQDPYLIMDIGGGSVEFIIANKNTTFWQ